MRILVLGGTRFIGPWVVRLLAGEGHEVTIFHRGETEADLPASVRHVHGDFARFSDHVGGLRDGSPEVVLDMVPCFDKDGHGVKHFRGIAHRAVVTTSADVYRAYGRLWRSEPGPPDSAPLTEDSPLRAQRAGDGAVGIEFDNIDVERDLPGDPELPVTIMRLPATHGPGDRQHRLYPYLKRIDDRRPAILLDETFARWHWTRGYVENVAAAIALAVQDERATGRVFNVADPVVHTEADWVRRIGAVAGWEGQVVALPTDQLPESLRQPYDFSQDYTVDSSRIRRELGYTETVNEEDALRRTIEWERQNPPNPKSSEFDYQAEDAFLADLLRESTR